MNVRAMVSSVIPPQVKALKKQRKWSLIRKQFGELSVAEAFTATYRTKLWGETEGEEFCSGGGSTEAFAGPYISALGKLVAEAGISTVVDLGCGDFRVGRKLCAALPVSYTGVDVVPDLVAYNNKRFGSDRVQFLCRNIIDDELPQGELCLIRQVLQHLSNEQIAKILAKCAKYPYLVITEDVYQGPGMRPNLDHTHGPDNRLFQKSGVYIDLPPYSLKATTMVELPVCETNSIIRTSLIRNKASSTL